MMGRNLSLGGNSVVNKTDKPSRNKSLIWQSKEGSQIASFKSPQIRGNRVKQPLQYHRSLSNGQNTISSIANNTRTNFPPIGFGKKEPSDTLKETAQSKQADSNQYGLRSNDNSSIMSPIPYEKKYYGKGQSKQQRLTSKESSQLSNHHRRMKLLSNTEIGGGFNRVGIDNSRGGTDQRQSLIVG